MAQSQTKTILQLDDTSQLLALCGCRKIIGSWAHGAVFTDDIEEAVKKSDKLELVARLHFALIAWYNMMCLPWRSVAGSTRAQAQWKEHMLSLGKAPSGKKHEGELLQISICNVVKFLEKKGLSIKERQNIYSACTAACQLRMDLAAHYDYKKAAERLLNGGDPFNSVETVNTLLTAVEATQLAFMHCDWSKAQEFIRVKPPALGHMGGFISTDDNFVRDTWELRRKVHLKVIEAVKTLYPAALSGNTVQTKAGAHLAFTLLEQAQAALERAAGEIPIKYKPPAETRTFYLEASYRTAFAVVAFGKYHAAKLVMRDAGVAVQSSEDDIKTEWTLSDCRNPVTHMSSLMLENFVFKELKRGLQRQLIEMSEQYPASFKSPVGIIRTTMGMAPAVTLGWLTARISVRLQALSAYLSE